MKPEDYLDKTVANFDARLKYTELVGDYLQKFQRATLEQDYPSFIFLLESYYNTTMPFIPDSEKIDELEKELTDIKELLKYYLHHNNSFSTENMLRDQIQSFHRNVIKNTRHLLMPLKKIYNDIDEDKLLDESGM